MTMVRNISGLFVLRASLPLVENACSGLAENKFAYSALSHSPAPRVLQQAEGRHEEREIHFQREGGMSNKLSLSIVVMSFYC